MNKHEILSKYAKHFASKYESQPLLHGIHYAADGSAVVTNRQWLLRIKGVHDYAQPTTLHVKTGAPIDGEYPETSKVFPTSYKERVWVSDVEMKDTVKIAGAATQLASLVSKEMPVVRLETANGLAELVVLVKKHNIKLQAFLGNCDNARLSSKRSMNGNYLTTALQLFADVGNGVQITLNGPLDPMVFSDPMGDIEVLILPFKVAE